MPFYEMRILDACGDFAGYFQMYVKQQKLVVGRGKVGGSIKTSMGPQCRGYKKELFQIQGWLSLHSMSVGLRSPTPSIQKRISGTLGLNTV